MKLHSKFPFLIIATLSLTLSAEPLLLNFDHITVDQGLSNHVVYDLIQDSEGFLWIANESGLDRYDGYSFRNFRYDPEDPQSHSFNRIREILETHHDDTTYLWLATTRGLHCLNLVTEQFTNYINDPDNPLSIRNNSLRTVCEGKEGSIWTGGWFGLDHLNCNTGEFEHYLPGADIRDIYRDIDGTLWIATRNRGLIHFYPVERTFKEYRYDPKNLNTISSDVLAKGLLNSTFYGSDYLWVSTSSKGYNLFNKESETFERLQPIPEKPKGTGQVQFESFYRGANELWIRSWPFYVHIRNLETNNYSYLQYDPHHPEGLRNPLIEKIIQDRSDVIWAGGYLGISRLNRQKQQFEIIGFKENIRDELISPDIGGLHYNSANEFWIATTAGICLMDPETEKIRNFINNPIFPYPVKQRINHAPFTDRSNYVWFMTNLGLFRMNPERNKIVSYIHNPNDPDSPAHLFFNNCIEDKNGDMWFATGDGLDKYIRKEDRFIHFLQNNEITCLLYPRIKGRDIILAGTRQGFFEMDMNTGDYNAYWHDETDPFSLNNGRIHTFYQDKNDILWVGANAGLNWTNITERENGKWLFKHITEKDGLPSNTIASIIEDQKGRMWVSTANGISLFDHENMTFRNYDQSDGLSTNIFYQRACMIDPKGYLYFGGFSGITKFHPDSLQDNEHIPNIALTDFQLFHKSAMIDPQKAIKKNGEFYLPGNINYLDSVYLNYDQDVFTIEFAALDYRNPQKNRYAYMLEGFDDDWTYVDASNRRATYTNLHPGKYVFRVRGTNNDGLWNDRGRSLKIIIRPPWWRTKIAYVSYVLLLCLAIYIFWQFQMGRIRLKHQVEIEHLEKERYQEIDALKSRFFTNISHEFRTPLTLILGPIEKMLNRLKDKESRQDLTIMQKHAKRLLYLVTQLLDISKLESHKMMLKTSEMDIIPLLRGILQSYSSLADKKYIRLSFKTDKEKLLVYVQQDIINKIFNNLLINAFKFTEAGGSICVDVKTNDKTKTVSISVIDTGIGIPEDRLGSIFDRFYQVDGNQNREYEGTGIGLSLIKELVDLHKATIEVHSELGSGSTFTVHFRLGKDHLEPKEIEKYTTDILPKMIDPDTLIDTDNTASPHSSDINKWESTWEILIVEDNADVRKYIRGYLEDDYACSEANNGLEGFKMALRILPDLIISDIMMPQIDGVEFTRKLKGDERTSHIPVILLTAKADIEDRLDGLETGADDYLTKPFEARELKVRIKNLIELRHKLQDRFRKEYSIIPDDIDLTAVDKKFMNKVVAAIKDNIDNTDFNIEKLAKCVFMSRQHLNRKLKALTGNTAQEFLRLTRLKTAVQLLRARESSITEIAYRVGFSTPSYFSEQFKRQFGHSPSDFIKKSKS